MPWVTTIAAAVANLVTPGTPVLEREFSPCRGIRVMPTSTAILSDQE